MELLTINHLTVAVGEDTILRDITLRIREGELHVLMGPNAAGKSTLLRTIMGLPPYRVVEGRIYFLGRDITEAPPHERARMGLALAHQQAPRLRVRAEYFLQRLSESYGSTTQVTEFVKKLRVEHLLQRELYVGFSGGEFKRFELLTVLLQRPKLALLDEPDSGVDVDSVKILAEAVRELVSQGSSVLLVTHVGLILRYLREVDYLHVLMSGRLVYSGDPSILPKILESGYSVLNT